jgi:hypothetical protein
MDGAQLRYLPKPKVQALMTVCADSIEGPLKEYERVFATQNSGRVVIEGS